MSHLERIAYDNALRALDKQERLLEELRARTGVLLAASSISASLLGARHAPPPAFTAAVALVAFAVTLGASLFVLFPNDQMAFAVIKRPTPERREVDVGSAYRRLTTELYERWSSNELQLARNMLSVRVATGGVGVTILCLIVLMSGTL